MTTANSQQLTPTCPHCGRAMAASGEMLNALQAVAAKLGSRPYGTGSYLPKPIRDQVFAAIAMATGQKDSEE